MKSPMDFHRHFHRVDFATFAIFALCEFLSLFMGLVIGGGRGRARGTWWWEAAPNQPRPRRCARRPACPASPNLHYAPCIYGSARIVTSAHACARTPPTAAAAVTVTCPFGHRMAALPLACPRCPQTLRPRSPTALLQNCTMYASP